jgi:regulation of enolase protein 1 (concanavalin A-like superfamily)
MEWLNEPASWQRTGDVLTVSVDPGTDFWRETGYGYIRDSGHVYGEVLAGDLDVSVRLRAVLETQFDQAGVMLRADEQTWLKTGIEFFEGRPRLSTVLTLGRSSWMVTDLPNGADDILLRVSRRGDAVEVRYLVGDGQPELAALVYMPPGAEMLAGVMAAAPEGPGFRVSFHELHVAERGWSEGTAAAGDWPDEGEPAWTGDRDAPAWAGAAEWPGESAAPATEPTPSWKAQEPAPAWNGGPPEDEQPVWADGEPESEDPVWAGGEPESERPGWAAGAASEDHPSWPAADPSGDQPSGPSGDHPSGPSGDHPSWPAEDLAEDVPGGDDPDWVKKLADSDEPDWATDAASRGTRNGAAAVEDEPAADTPAEPGDRPGGGPGKPDNKAAGQEEKAAGQEKAEPTDPSLHTWAPAPTLGPPDWARPMGEDAVTDWDRLAAGVQAGRSGPPAERWTAQNDADVANEWPGPPLRAARRAAIRNGLTAEGPAEAPAPTAGGEEPGSPAEGGLPGDQTGPGLGSVGSKGPGHAKRRSAGPDPAPPPKAATARPPLDLPGPPDPADEWISLLTADPAEE